MAVTSLAMRGRPVADRPDPSAKRTTAGRVKFAAIVGFGALMGGAVVNATWLQTDHVGPPHEAAAIAQIEAPQGGVAEPVPAPKVLASAMEVKPEAALPAIDPLPVGSIAKPRPKKIAARRIVHAVSAPVRKKDAIAALLGATPVRPKTVVAAKR